MAMKGKHDGARLGRVKHRHPSTREAFAELSIRAGRRGVLRIGNDDQAGLNGVKKGFGQWFALLGNPRDHDVGAQVRFTSKEGILGRFAQTGKEQDAPASEFPSQDDGFIVRLREIVFPLRVQHVPWANLISSLDGSNQTRDGLEAV